MIATIDDFTSHVVAHAGVATPLAERVSLIVLAGIGGYLAPSARQLVASELPPALGAAVVAGSGLATPIEARVRAVEPNVGHARELIASVCRVLAEALSSEALGAVHAAVPASLAALFEPASTSEVPPPPVLARPRETLAEGRAGSHDPVSEARAPGAQRDSVAAGNPHAATKLSSTTGSTQERHHETIAEGRQGRASPIAGSRG